MRKHKVLRRLCIVYAFCFMTAIATPAQSFFSLHSFDQTDGYDPYATLIQGTDGKFYGTTQWGGAYGAGTVFSITRNGTLKTLHSFNGADGEQIQSGLVQGTNGIFYGTTATGNSQSYGTIFSVTADGTFTTLYSFCTSGPPCLDGASPSTLIQGTNGKFYGTAFSGGANGDGTIFSFTASGTLTVLHSFTGKDGFIVYGRLIEGTDGKFYGTTSSGGNEGYGTVFSVTADGMLKTLHQFDYTDGAAPYAGLVQGEGGNLYGTTLRGGANGYGTIFKITPAGMLTVLYNFCPKSGCADGSEPYGGLVRGTDGNLYGTTFSGGTYLGNLCAPYGCGTIFQFTAGGVLRTLHTFDNTDGEAPYAGLLQATNGKFYGTTLGGGGYNGYPYGTVFSLSVALGQFVEADPVAGRVGSKVIILGTNLTRATSVTFNGTSATFTVVSPSEITTTVPVGCTTGEIQVVTPSGTLSSNAPYRVAT